MALVRLTYNSLLPLQYWVHHKSKRLNSDAIYLTRATMQLTITDATDLAVGGHTPAGI